MEHIVEYSYPDLMVAKENSDLLEAYKTYLKKQMIIKICNCQTLFFVILNVI